jgi:multicomponent Na+:H+ antiporter subunit E
MSAMRLSGVLLWSTLLWVSLWHDVSVANVVAGLLVGVAVLAVARVPRVLANDDAGRVRIRPLASVYFIGFVLYKLVEANLVLAWEIVTPRNRINIGVVAVPLRTESTTAAMIVANVITLTPGSITIESLGSPPTLYVNVMHLHDVERVRHDLLHIEELSVRAFGSAIARAQLAERVST